VNGNEGNQFEIMNKKGVWSLHFRRRLREAPANFQLEIRAINDIDVENSIEDESLDLNVHIQVVP